MPRPLLHPSSRTWLRRAGALALLACAWPFAPAVAAATTPSEEVRAVHDLLGRGEAEAALRRLEARDGAAPAVSNGSTGPDAELRFLRGVALMDLQRNAEALGWFERMAQDHPELPDPFNNIALLHVRAGRLEQARQALETALRNDPSYRVARANLGLVHLMLAVQAWQQLAASGPVDAQVLRRLEGARQLLAGPAPAATSAPPRR